MACEACPENEITKADKVSCEGCAITKKFVAADKACVDCAANLI